MVCKLHLNENIKIKKINPEHIWFWKGFHVQRSYLSSNLEPWDEPFWAEAVNMANLKTFQKILYFSMGHLKYDSSPLQTVLFSHQHGCFVHLFTYLDIKGTVIAEYTIAYSKL